MVQCGVIDPCATNQYAYPNVSGSYNTADMSLLGYPEHHVDKRMAKPRPISNPQYTYDGRYASPQYMPCKMLISLKTNRNYKY